MSELSVHVFKAGPTIKSIAAAKARRKVPGCDAQPMVEEGSDHYIYNCKMRSMEGLQLLVLKEASGVTYACESRSTPTKVEDLDAVLATCRTLQPI